jgi:hypothetical protein
MLLTDITNIQTLLAIKKYNLDISSFANKDELKQCIKKKSSEFYRSKEYMKQYYEKNKATMKFSNKKQPNEYFREYYHKNKDKFRLKNFNKKKEEREKLYEAITSA